MRSRYSAYVVGDLGYIETSWHPDFRPADLSLDDTVRWLGLKILGSARQGERATVEFEASLLAENRVDAIHENSSFVRQQGRWLYTDGEMLEPGFEPWKPGRNESCPCGSGKKFKRCCAQH